ncbi:type VI secretion system ATPase TssH [Holophaga foetida]|uniref:type VI secretion system ATPase TssH n=1 Tax=Holophaga foetida TaxID=35839 RepID=UPI0002472A6A|nr:type VI secretion system ATPase TssH [Holophaga foetida]
MKTGLKPLIGKLNPLCRRAMETAVNVALSRTHHEVDVEHVLLELLALQDSDCVAILKAYDIQVARLEKDLLAGLSRLKTGNTRSPVLSVNIPRWLETAWLMASVDHGAAILRSGFLLEALVVDEDLRRTLGSSCELLGRIPADELKKNLPAILRSAKEGAMSPAPASGEGEGTEQKGMNTTGAPTRALDSYTSDLTALARVGKLDPVLGRDGEIRQMIDILLRRRQNNPILTGEPGVGKTAVVEGLAARIVEGDVPDPLKNVALRSLDMGLLQAGASVKGEFENRVRSVIDEVKGSLIPIILFIDEAHTMIGAGGQAGQSDAANLLKPALARGELRTIAATTWSEYKKYFEKDAALARRFQVVKVEEPSEDSAIQMMRGIAVAMETHHKVRILDEAVVDAVKLSSRYVAGRQLPDKCVSVLDTACARVALSQASKPAAVEDLTRLIENIDRESAALDKEKENPQHKPRQEELKKRRAELEIDLEKQLGEQKLQAELVQEVRSLRERITMGDDSKEAQTQLRSVQERLRDAHKTQPLIYDCVDSATVAEVISGWTGIPLGRMVADEIGTIRNLKALLEARVIGQPHALELIARHIQIARANLEDPGKPKGVFLLVGPSGVGKTETALALADVLYGGERNLISINMSEYQEAHTVSGLKGSPPGYVGYGEGGVLTEAVRRKPYSVLLLDEVEKAHPDVLELFYQVFDKGLMEDAEGREIDFRNTIILLTSNIGSDLVLRAVEHGVKEGDKVRQPTPQDLQEVLRPTLQKACKPAFLGRLSVVPYYPVQDEILKAIIRLKMEKIRKRIEANHSATMTYDNALIELMAARCTEVESGARNADAIISQVILADLSGRLLERMSEGKKIKSIALKTKKDKVSFQIV